MRSAIGNMLGYYERGLISRRQFVESLAVLAAAGVCAPAALAVEPPAQLVPVSVNHIAISVSNLKRSRDWYTSLFKLKVVQENDHFALLQFGNTQLVLRSPTPDRPPSPPGTISHFMFGLAPYDEPALFENLRSRGFTPRKDLESAIIRDPDNLVVQIGDLKMGLDTGYPLSAT